MLIRGGTLVTHQGMTKGDIRIRGSKIAAIGASLPVLIGEEVINAHDMYVMPGMIDAHTHFGLRSRGTITADDPYYGSVSALMGGVTTVIDYADLLPGESLARALEFRKQEFVSAMVDYNFHLVINDNLCDSQLAEFAHLRSYGINSLKLFTTYKDANYLLPKELWFRVLSKSQECGLLVTVHAEDDELITKILSNREGPFVPADHPDLRPSQAEFLGVQEVLELAKRSKVKLYIVHVSCKEALQCLVERKKAKDSVFIETTPHYLLLNRDLLKREDAPLYIMTPPLRTNLDQASLLSALQEGYIDVVATDHCAFTVEQKSISKDPRFVLPGIPGVETLLPLLFTYGAKEGKITVPKMVEVVSTNPAKIFGLYPEKGSLQVGTDADITIYDPNYRGKITANALHSQAGYTPFESMDVWGKVELAMVRGRVMTLKGELLPLKGWGRFVPANAKQREGNYGNGK